MRFLLVVGLLVVVIVGPSEPYPGNRDGDDDPNGPCHRQPNGRYVNNPAKCRAFWSCQDGKVIPVNCPIGYNFNEEAQLCDLAKHFPCTDGEDPIAPTTTTRDPITTEEPTVTTENPGPTTEPGPPSCDGLPEGHFINNPINCGAHWVCQNGQAHPAQCPDGLNFNEKGQSCDDPENYPCGDDDDEPPTTPTTQSPPLTTDNPLPPFQCPSNGIHAFPLPDTCTTYRFCFAGALRIRSCADGLQFDEVRSRCDFANNVNCIRGICPSQNDPDNIVTLSSRHDCGQFYVCYDGELQEFKCAPGLWWNQALTRCDNQSNVECQINQPPTTTEPPLVIECPGDDVPGPHILPHPRDCTKSFVCSRGNPYPRTCPEDLLFDPKLLTCNKPERVTCYSPDSANDANDSIVWF